MSTFKRQMLYPLSLQVSQGEDCLANKSVTIKEIALDITAILDKINAVLKDHELRLQSIEDLKLKTELSLLKCKIFAIPDSEKQAEALQAFNNLCQLLAISDLEATNS
jgi:hypothetical protein